MPRQGLSLLVSIALIMLAVGACAALLPAVEEPAPAAPPAKAPAKAPAKPNPVLAPVQDEPGLPRVLLIGDSISMGYTLPVRALLKGKANVHRIRTNGGPTTNGLKNLDAWVGDGKWDVIHFNWGLHDLKHMDEKGNLTDVATGRRQVAIDAYEKNLEELVKMLKRTGARLVWAATTPVPEGAAGRIPADVPEYNAAAMRVMKANDVAVNDLYAFALPQLEKIQLPKNVHFKPEGSDALASQVAASILKALEKPAPPPDAAK
jgi:acyl-CoA thioesterase-1